MYFPSKKDWWMTIIIWLIAGLFMVGPVFFPNLGVWMTLDFLDKQWIKILVLFPMGLVLVWIWFQTGYRIEGNSLIIQSGPIKKIIRINEIYRIRETKNPFTAAALSMDKLEIYYAKYDFISISPENNKVVAAFMPLSKGKSGYSATNSTFSLSGSSKKTA